MDDIDLMQYESEILTILRSDIPPAEKRIQLDIYHDYELSQVMLTLTDSERDQFFQCFTSDQLANIFAQLPPEEAVELLRIMPAGQIKDIFEGMQSDDLIDVIECFTDPDERLTYLTLVGQKKRQGIMALLDFNENLAGSIMNNNYIQINKEDSVKTAIKKMVDQAPQTEFINNLYVVDSGYLVGVLSLKEIISAGNRPQELIKDIMTTNLVAITPGPKTRKQLRR